MRTLVRMTFLIAFSLAAVAHADDSSALNKAAAALAAQTYPEAQHKATLDRVVEVTVQSLTSTFEQNGQTLPADFPKNFRTEMERLLPYQEMIDMQAGLLAKYYTVAELQELAAFYKSPVGQKSLKIMPEVMADVMGQMQMKMQRELPGMMQRLLPEAGAPQKKASRKGK